MSDVNIDVTKFLDDMHHPLRPEIEFFTGAQKN